MLRIVRCFMLIALGLFSSHLAASTLLAPIAKDQLKQSNTGAYLGVGLDLLPAELSAQLPEDVLIGQSILVSGFMLDSPAPKQGMKLFDILLSYNDIALKHPQQFIQLIKKATPKQVAKISIVRQGKTLTLPITLGAQNYPLDEDQLDYQFDMQVMGYSGYQMKMPSKNYFETTIRFLAPDGVVRRRTFKGYYNQIMPEIQAAPDLSRFAKQKLTGVISERKDDEDGWFGDWMPFSDGNFF